jgi:hypothetical protein
MGDRKSCFVIGPIGEAGAEHRRVADWLLKGIVKPVLENEPFGYEVTRADECPDPGSISDQIITAVMEADLVIADLTSHNPNAFYELAIRHMVEKPVIHMILKGQAIPFDNRDYRTLVYDLADIEDLEKAKQALAEQVEAVSRPDYKVSNPITKARGHQALASSSDTRDQAIAQLLSTVGALEHRLASIEDNPALLSPNEKLVDALTIRSAERKMRADTIRMNAWNALKVIPNPED